MNSRIVLMTNHALKEPAGSEWYVCDLATRLLEFGWRPVVYTQRLGRIAERLMQATIPVISDLEQLGASPTSFIAITR